MEVTNPRYSIFREKGGSYILLLIKLTPYVVFRKKIGSTFGSVMILHKMRGMPLKNDEWLDVLIDVDCEERM